MYNKAINIGVVAEVAEGLQQYREQVVFVGGAVISLYTDDPAADEIRPTKDIDFTINIVNVGEFHKTIEELGKLGFHPDPYGTSICSYTYKKYPVDIIPAEDNAFGSTNRWYKIGFEDLWKVKAKNQEIYILSFLQQSLKHSIVGEKITEPAMILRTLSTSLITESAL